MDILNQSLKAYEKELSEGKRNLKRYGFLFLSLMLFTAIFLVIFILFMLTFSLVSTEFSLSTLGLTGILMILSAALGYRILDNWSLFLTISQHLTSEKKKGELL